MPPRISSNTKTTQKKLVVSKTLGKRNLPVPDDYVSPLKKRREARREAAILKKERIIATAQGLRAYYTSEDKQPDEIVLIYGRFLWDSYHVTKQGRHIIHLHFFDAVTDDTVEDLLEDYAYEGERNFDSDKELMTATVWDEVEGCKGIPTPGDIACVSRFTGLTVFRGEACQFNTKLADLRVESSGQYEGGVGEEDRTT